MCIEGADGGKMPITHTWYFLGEATPTYLGDHAGGNPEGLEWEIFTRHYSIIVRK